MTTNAKLTVRGYTIEIRRRENGKRVHSFSVLLFPFRLAARSGFLFGNDQPSVSVIGLAPFCLGARSTELNLYFIQVDKFDLPVIT